MISVKNKSVMKVIHVCLAIKSSQIVVIKDFRFKKRNCRLTHHENIICRWQLATSLYEMQQIKKLTVNVSANL